MSHAHGKESELLADALRVFLPEANITTLTLQPLSESTASTAIREDSHRLLQHLDGLPRWDEDVKKIRFLI